MRVEATDKAFPPELRGLTSSLWLRGQAQALAIAPKVTIVGSRVASARGLLRAEALGRALGERGALTISGGAIGIDAAAHRGALSAGGRTCAVLGTGVDVCYPVRHAALFAAISEQGCLLSMWPLQTPPRPQHFPQRNELMAALADTVIVVEAQLRSGTGYTAGAAKKRGRRLICFADSPGTAALIQAGAHGVTDVAEVLDLLDTSSSSSMHRAKQPEAGLEKGAQLPLDPASAKLLASLLPDPLDLGELCARTGLSAADCAAAVIDLELRGHCSRLPGGRYIGHAPLS